MHAFCRHPRLGYLAAVVAGVLTTLSAAPFMLWWLAPIAAGLMYAGLSESTPRQAAWRGWYYGLGLFASGVSWVYVSIHDFGYTGVPLAIALTALFVAAMALFPAVSLGLYRRLIGPRLDVITFAGAWVLGEALRTWLFTGFPWLLLGSGQVDSPLAPWAPVGGAYLLSLVTALSGALGVQLLRRRWWCALPLAGLWLMPLALPMHWTQPAGDPVRVALLQGNLSQHIKWTPQGQRTAIDTYLRQTRQLNSTPLDLVIWPEAALPMFEDRAAPIIERAQASLGDETQLLTGILQRDAQGLFYNSVVGRNGVEGEYRKHHLVPFGEYLPLESLLRGAIAFFDLPMPAMTPGAADQAPLMAAGTHIGNAICYEIIYADLVAKQAREAEVILTLSNDSWFGDSLGPQQHLQMARLRALENGRYVVRATSNGVTAIIDSRGRITKRLPQFETATLIGEFTPMEGLTPFTHTGSWPVWLLGLGMALAGVRGRRRRG
ncbi:apolipoprotein N-acyltransferase [Halomonas sp. 18H]|uniref:apolipoprotein N-acyltransferase n=1 Tax=Halomonas almeriensis TaxID=308163 RepID=UPI00222EDB13|nr:MULTISPECIES: apolipoprotein N-acyltransferase [Halomonas]MCW4149369.1 apolipoprotein N-acyltransferase [Halomonas sp. 18H]MDN3553685.1 apolipoprotein N-acyltransferase [Halomonas almeriensis]